MGNCIRCGVPLVGLQRKYCSPCANEKQKEYFKKYKERQKAAKKAGKKANQAKTTKERYFFDEEREICLNCKRPKCNDCLSLLSVAEKRQMLEEIKGGSDG